MQDALLAATVSIGAQMGALVASAPDKPVAQAKKVDVATLVRHMRLSCSVCLRSRFCPLIINYGGTSLVDGLGRRGCCKDLF